MPQFCLSAGLPNGRLNESRIMDDQKIYVYANWREFEEPLLMGILTATRIRGKEIFSFTYDVEWLQTANSQVIDPDLQLYAGAQYLQEEKVNFGMFMDSAPDRWGRVLMRRREAAYARTEGRKERRFFETDYLLGVFDGHRMGGLRFKYSSDGPFLNNDRSFSTPPWTSLRELEYASLQLENQDSIDDANYLKWLSLLVTPGSSLGGARPKASVLDDNDQLWIAKFPSKRDDRDIGAWEKLVHDLAIQAGITVPPAKVQRYSSRYHTFLSKRFDRYGKGKRIHFASAMTLLGYADGSNAQDGVSYLELVEFLMQHGAKADHDLQELWRRIVFNICVSNTDDHLRNHGCLLTPSGWVLSPAYDLNPDPTGAGLSLNISENDNSLDLDLAMEVAIFFRLTETKAREIIQTTQNAVKQWQFLAQKYRIPRSEQSDMAPAFRH